MCFNKDTIFSPYGLLSKEFFNTFSKKQNRRKKHINVNIFNLTRKLFNIRYLLKNAANDLHLFLRKYPILASYFQVFFMKQFTRNNTFKRWVSFVLFKENLNRLLQNTNIAKKKTFSSNILPICINSSSVNYFN